MIGPLRRVRDPFFDDGKGARRRRRRLRIEGLVALTLAIVACGMMVATWIVALAPLGSRIRLG
jgi:hypothetical protein